MANVMSMKQVKNSVTRNGFDLSMKRNFTAKAGELLPVMCKEVIPGDKVTIDLSSFTRTMPVNTAAFARIREYYDFFFVPFSHLWNRSNTVLSQMDYNQMHATALNAEPSAYAGELPYITQSQIAGYVRNLQTISDAMQKVNMFGFNRSYGTCKLLEYLGYGRYYDFIDNSTGGLEYNLELNVMGLLAYQKIYADFYRDEQWEKPSPSCFNVDYMNGTSSMQMQIPAQNTDPFFQNYNLFDLRYCNWPKDLYHGILPNAQYGDTAVVPLDYSVAPQTSTLKGVFHAPNATSNAVLKVSVGGTGPLERVADSSVGQTFLSMPAVHPTTLQDWQKADLNYVSSLKTSGSASLSILALRQYEFLQKWKEIVQSTGQNYKDQTKAIWGVDVSDHLSDMCTYLGGISSSLSINEVVNTNLTGDYSAEIAGKGVGIANGKITFDSRGEFGYLMCIYHCMPVVDYTTSYTDPQFMRVNAEDFANPVFDKVGMQQITTASILNRFSSAYDFSSTPRPLGFVPRYADYKTSIDTSVGAFIDSMSHWVVSYDAQDIFMGLTGGLVSDVGDDTKPTDSQGDVVPTYQYLKINPHLLDPIFTVEADSTNDSDQFLCSAFFDIKAVRNLDVNGLPY